METIIERMSDPTTMTIMFIALLVAVTLILGVLPWIIIRINKTDRVASETFGTVDTNFERIAGYLNSIEEKIEFIDRKTASTFKAFSLDLARQIGELKYNVKRALEVKSLMAQIQDTIASMESHTAKMDGLVNLAERTGEELEYTNVKLNLLMDELGYEFVEGSGDEPEVKTNQPEDICNGDCENCDLGKEAVSDKTPEPKRKQKRKVEATLPFGTTVRYQGRDWYVTGYSKGRLVLRIVTGQKPYVTSGKRRYQVKAQEYMVKVIG